VKGGQKRANYTIFCLVKKKFLFLELLDKFIPCVEIPSIMSFVFQRLNFLQIIAICAKVWNRVNRSNFAFSEAETCSAHISTTRRSIPIILVDLECTSWYLSHNVVYMRKNLRLKFICGEGLIWECASLRAISCSKFIYIKPDINLICYFTVRSAERIVEIGLVLPKNEETRCRLHHTATPFFIPPFHHNHGTDFHNSFCIIHCKIAYYIDIWLYMCKFRAGNSSRACTLSNEAFLTNEFQSEVFSHINYIVQ